MCREEMRALGWERLDVLLITGDAYVDHPSFGCVLLARWLIHHGFRTGLVAQPRWDRTDDLLVMGRPRLFAGISAGALDSLLAHYTAFRKKRRDDAYTPGGRAGARPNRACLVYANLARQAFPGLPLVLGGIEASLRRVSHYDFWTDALRRPILMDAKADLLVWGMGERAILECARRLDKGAGADALAGIPGTAWLDRLDARGHPARLPASLANAPLVALPGHQQILDEPEQLLRLTQALEQQVHRGDAWAFEPVDGRALVLAPPAVPLSTAEMDELYSLPFRREAHPSYREAIPAAEMLRTSITSHRGCGGGCSFCSLALHQGRHISSRSAESILDEARALARAAMTSGRRGKDGVAISDVGGPTANMWQAHCALEEAAGTECGASDGMGRKSRCRRLSCCFPTVCKAFVTPQRNHVELLRAVAALPGVKQVRVASGVRADLALRDPEALAAYTGEFTGGQLKVAPEHCAPSVLALMRKPPLATFETFLESFVRQSRAAGREQYVIPYLMSAFPGCTDEDMRTLAHWLRQRHWNPRQTQCFIPTPGTIATAMYYCGKNEAGEDIAVARTDAARLRQHHILMPSTGRPEKRAAAQTAKQSKKHGRS
ncbi:YgiQ family radical SAM protein [uncultured Desulfovibrio sp.]|uniref:YgiQ family radical SAM protein n=2 Tax=uncultured Desulfovibrio sp. TaxID=167968 RepID=UPI002608173D|nr:YgiQ family radical SAM protein [uncultured Desulfovibrio sp.]